MAASTSEALQGGLARITAWADLLDQINVFPVADGDTGRNLVISLNPLGCPGLDQPTLVQRLKVSARGNSGNIAASFFSGFLLQEPSTDWLAAARKGRDAAWLSMAEPVPGTMLTLFDALVEGLSDSGFTEPPDLASVTDLIHHLESAVRQTRRMLPRLRSSDLVDAGALGMFLFFEGFFGRLTGCEALIQPATHRFQPGLTPSMQIQGDTGSTGHCVDLLIHTADAERDQVLKRFSAVGDSLTAASDKDRLKIHIHTRNREAVKETAEQFGQVINWSEESIRDELDTAVPNGADTAVHIMTDAAGSLTRPDARRMGITLLDSYIQMGRDSLPETRVSAADLYGLLRRGKKVSTAQASVFERHQYYQSVLSRFDRVLYLCVGSAYTGNYTVASTWQKENDPERRFTVIDTGTVSGSLALMVMGAQAVARQTGDLDAVTAFADAFAVRCEEYLFPERLHYLAASGRLSKTGAFFGDVLHMKPVITPTPQGARKVSVVRNRRGQIDFALQRLSEAQGKLSTILLEYTDNRPWVETHVLPRIKNDYPDSTIRLQPLSLTAGVHMGPDTWAVAFVKEPDAIHDEER